MKKMTLMPPEKIKDIFTGGGWNTGFIAKKEHPLDACLTVFLKYPNGAEYYSGMEIRTPRTREEYKQRIIDAN